MRVIAQLYRQFDADPARDVPAEAYGGWHQREIEISPRNTALVVMHAWDCGQPHEFPGWRRAVEYMPRAETILKSVFPPLLDAVRKSPIRIFHVVGSDRDYYSHLPGHKETVRIAGAAAEMSKVKADPVYRELQEIRRAEGMPGTHNVDDVSAGFARIDFAPEAWPRDGEPIAANGAQLGALCREHGINHLIYVGFAINWCLLMSPGGMVDMARQGCLCSTIAEAVTAVENRETARTETEKQQALWRVAVEFGFVFRYVDFIAALPRGT